MKQRKTAEHYLELAVTEDDKAQLIRNGVFTCQTLYYMVNLCVVRPELFFKVAKKQAQKKIER